jgi:hypothetical protein
MAIIEFIDAHAYKKIMSRFRTSRLASKVESERRDTSFTGLSSGGLGICFSED